MLHHLRRFVFGVLPPALAVSTTLSIIASSASAQVSPCQRTVTARVVALDQPFVWNRLGAVHPQGMVYALRRDVVNSATGLGEGQGGVLTAGNVRLRDDRRPRPLVLRMNVGDCLSIQFQNLLRGAPLPHQPATRAASIHAIGMQLATGIGDDGSNVGVNGTSLVGPGGSRTYTLYAEHEGNFILQSGGALAGGEGDGGSLNNGLFGMLNVEPRGSKWYRSQLTESELLSALNRNSPNQVPGNPGHTADGHPILNYGARYPAGHRFANLPIVEILNGLEIVHSDLTAIVAEIPANTYAANPVYPNRNQGFREFTIVYHDEIGAQQAFPAFTDPALENALASVVDGFAINYGTGGAGAEVLANRLGVGPMWDCTECKFEEFFLSAWAMGDPAMVVDVPANTTDAQGNLIAGAKATRAFYPDDPSNVYHSYLGDHVKFRIGHGGSKEHHIHHQHTHQWLFNPDSDESAYLDSQALGPGAAYTLEMVHNGSGNRNQAVGDAIFHCHFYPHFAQGMWSLWRVHDVFEDGSRKLPDGEIVTGTPIPAIVPVPTRPMAPMPGARVDIVPLDGDGNGTPDSGQIALSPLPGQAQIGNPGFPFFVPGVAGHRPPRPPMDLVDDGGLPRHVVVSDPSSHAEHVETALDFTKELKRIKAVEVAENGAPAELAAMAYHAQRFHDTVKPDGVAATGTQGFVTNGRPPARGAPYADPCIDDNGNPIGVDPSGSPRRKYKAADIQIDAVFNKSGWHFPQSRILSLWGDVQSYFNGARAPEPLFFRANSGECIEYHLTNLVPNVYELDDFQVRTPTDILGQHIHLVKFDGTSSDGSGNGFNYEDGALSPDEVRERIQALNDFDGPGNGTSGFQRLDGTHPELAAQPHPVFGSGPNGKFLGAQTNVQRWMADPVLNLAGKDRTLRTIFTHDHFGPSSHQQAGLYAGLVIEPAGTVWRDPESGAVYGGRSDGGPTSWRADIVNNASPSDSYREFLLEFADFQLAYRAGSHPELPSGGGPVFQRDWLGARVAGEGYDRPAYVINPPKIDAHAGGAPGTAPEAISAADVGTMTVNYRNEPLALRVHDPVTDGQAQGIAGDLSHAFRSTLVQNGQSIPRAHTELNDPPSAWPYSSAGGPPAGSASSGAQTGDPFTPLMRAYEGDKVQIRTLVGANEEGHNLSIHGLKWLAEPGWKNSGWRNSQMMGISEHFEMEAQLDPIPTIANADYLYEAGSSSGDLWNGIWGLLRATNRLREPSNPLLPLPSNPNGAVTPPSNASAFNGPCPNSAPLRTYTVHAVRAAQVLRNGWLVYNGRSFPGGILADPTAILYANTTDLQLLTNAQGQVTGARYIPTRVEPLILRANAGDCIQVNLVNHLIGPAVDLPGFAAVPEIVANFNANDVLPSNDVGLHPQLVDFEVTRSDGTNVGRNPVQTASPQPFAFPQNLDASKIATYRWYAGDSYVNANNLRVGVPIEFGSVNLIPSDPVKHPSKGAIGALIIEPRLSTWALDVGTKAQATITLSDGTRFRECVAVIQSDVNLRHQDLSPVRPMDGRDDAEDSGDVAVNYRTEPFWQRMGFPEDLTREQKAALDFANVLSNALVGRDPETPVFTARFATPTRFRVLKPGGGQRNHVFAVHGHVWEIEPFTHNANDPNEAAFGSTKIGANAKSMWEGSHMGIGPSSHENFVLKNGAGGRVGVRGDFLWHDVNTFHFDGGLWGIFRVTN
ncbi:MAG: copper oxidase [Planctomycetes bacterium]|nr:copper oxidase [Planctomycetota bacterium]